MNDAKTAKPLVPGPCPFPRCGSKQTMVVVEERTTFVKCRVCGARGPEMKNEDAYNEEQAVDEWNAATEKGVVV